MVAVADDGLFTHTPPTPLTLIPPSSLNQAILTQDLVGGVKREYDSTLALLHLFERAGGVITRPLREAARCVCGVLHPCLNTQRVM